MDILKTIAYDITQSVFNNDTEGMMYVTKDIYSDSFIISVPVFSFSSSVRETHTEIDYEWIKNHFPNVGGDYNE
jgi:hypothetical protein